MKTDHALAQKNGTLKSILGQNRGQLIVEYIFLIVIVTVVAVGLSTALVSRQEGNTGVIITKWAQLLEMVGADQGD